MLDKNVLGANSINYKEIRQKHNRENFSYKQRPINLFRSLKPSLIILGFFVFCVTINKHLL